MMFTVSNARQRLLLPNQGSPDLISALRDKTPPEDLMTISYFTDVEVHPNSGSRTVMFSVNNHPALSLTLPPKLWSMANFVHRCDMQTPTGGASFLIIHSVP